MEFDTLDSGLPRLLSLVAHFGPLRSGTMHDMHLRDLGIPIPTRSPSRSEVHLWRIALEPVVSNEERWQALLSPEERTRADRFRFAVDRQRYGATRAFVRSILASYLECDPQNVVFAYSNEQKPRLASPHAELDIRFNVSHSGGVSLLVFTQGREVGVDVEQVREEIDTESLVPRFFSPSELKEFVGYSAAQRKEAFFRGWTRKEAYIKAHGKGLSLPLQNFDVSLTPGNLDCLLATRPDPLEASRWSLREITAGQGYAAALCVEGGSWTLIDGCSNSQQ